MFRNLLNAYTATSCESHAEAMSVLYSIYAHITAEANRETDYHPKKPNINDTKAYIDHQFADITLSVRYLAELSGMSEVYFRKLFQAQYGCSPSQYISSTRICYAKHLMQYPFLSFGTMRTSKRICIFAIFLPCIQKRNRYDTGSIQKKGVVPLMGATPF